MSYLVSDLNNYLSKCTHVFEFFRSCDGVINALIDSGVPNIRIACCTMRNHIQSIGVDVLNMKAPLAVESYLTEATFTTAAGTNFIQLHVHDDIFTINLYRTNGTKLFPLGSMQISSASADLIYDYREVYRNIIENFDTVVSDDDFSNF